MLAALASTLVLAAAPAVGASLDAAAEALRSDHVHVDGLAAPTLTDQEARELRARIGSTPVYVAVVSREAAGGDAYQAALRLASDVGRNGTYVFVSGRNIQAVSNQVPEVGGLVRAAIADSGDSGLAAILLDLVDRLEGRGDGDGDGGSTGGLILVGLLAAGGGGVMVSRRRRRTRELAEVKANVRDDLVALGEEIQALDLDIQMPAVTPEARADYERTVAAYERADSAWQLARRPEALEPVGAALEEGRYAIASARARLEGRPPPERRPPCFFDPRHGPSTRDVEWAPDFGAPRPVPACEACAVRVEAGEEPSMREWSVGGERVPYWAAGPAYGPFAGGMFGMGFWPGIFMGSMLGGGMSTDVAQAEEAGSADWVGGGGDLGGGGFGGGGGDFGGGFGGGGGDF